MQPTVIIPVKCRVCDQWKGEADAYPIDVIEADSELPGDNTDTVYVCESCVESHDGPGAHAGHHEDSLATLLALQYIDMNGHTDDFMWHEGWGYMARIGQYLYQQDTSGLHDYEDYRTVAEASRRFDQYYSEGWGYSEDDYIVSQSCDKFSVTSNGDDVGEYDSLPLALLAIEDRMQAEGFYPSVWRESGYGDLHSIDIGAEFKSALRELGADVPDTVNIRALAGAYRDALSATDESDV